MPLTPEQVNAMLEAKGLTQAKIAKKFHWHRSSVNRFLKGTRTSRRFRRWTARTLGVDESMLPRRDNTAGNGEGNQ